MPVIPWVKKQGLFAGVGYNHTLGRNTVLAEEILRGIFHEGEPVLVTVDGDRLVFSQKAAAEGALSS